MSFPIYPEKHKLKEMYGAREIVGYRKQVGRMPSLSSPEGILFCLERGLPWRLRWRIPVLRAGGMNGDLYALKKPKDKIGIMTGFGGGSPMTVELAEEFAAMGVKCMLLMTWGGILQPDLNPGDIVVIDRAIRDEGTSYHYLPPSKYVDANAGLADNLVESIQARRGKCSRGTTWTTDAPFRETVEEIRQYQAEGVKTVEMESAGLFTIGKVRNIPTASVVVGMDRLADYQWHVPERLEKILHSLELVYAASLDVLRSL
ncbi:MAG TPA: nucleoside phosphorylase [Anaerolineales bacterium]|nr:nucleoside phosphorylase [Anaerolineales bacterium]